MHRNNTINLAVWAGLVLVVAVLGMIINYKPIMLGMAYKTTKGTVNDTFPNNHLGISFSYKVSGHVYQSTVLFNHGSFQLGDAVTVFYDMHRPDSASLENPTVQLVRSIGQIVAACAILPVIGIYIIKRNRYFPNLYDYSKTTDAA